MATYQPATTPKPESVQDAAALEAAVRRYLSQYPSVEESLDLLWRRYGKHAVSADELRAELDKQLGDRTLTGELYKMRGK